MTEAQEQELALYGERIRGLNNVQLAEAHLDHLRMIGELGTKMELAVAKAQLVERTLAGSLFDEKGRRALVHRGEVLIPSDTDRFSLVRYPVAE